LILGVDEASRVWEKYQNKAEKYIWIMI